VTSRIPSWRAALLLGFAAAVALAGGCRGSGEDEEPATRYRLEGRVVSVDIEGRTLGVAHEEIPGFMPAMTMEFPVRAKEAVLLPNVAPGDEVSATLAVSASRHWIEDLVVVKKGAPVPGPSAQESAPGPRPGDELPDVALVNQDGRALHLSDYRGRALALTFVFTRCPMPDFCPLMMKGFAAVHAALVADPALRERTHLLTISFDPAHDTPEVLRAYGLPWQKTDPPFTHWDLATGEVEAIRELGAALDLEFVEEEGAFTHNLRTAVVDPEGRLVRLRRGNAWTAEELLADLATAARR